MQLVEQHVIQQKDVRFAAIDAAAFASKNLYNAALYELRQAFIHEGVYYRYEEMDKRMKQHEAYKALPAKVSQQVLKQLAQAWEDYFEARKAYRQNPAKFRGHPKLPKYKDKKRGRNLLVYTMQAISGGQTGGKKTLQRGIIKPSKLAIEVRTRQDPKTIDQVRIVPHQGHYTVEVVYEKKATPAEVNPAYYAGIDPGVNHLIALASNKPGFQSVVVNGRPVKSTNQYYNKRRAELQKQLGHPASTKRMERMTTKRNRRIHHYMHTASKRIIDLLVKEGMSTLIIGKNDGWKQEINHGKQNNQNFCFLPHARLIQMLQYKAELVGITVVLTEESYTSKASLLDLDPLPVWKQGDNTSYTFGGKRVKRGLYRASNGQEINADVNGAGNMIRKVAPDAFGSEGVEDGDGVLASLVVHPVRIVVPLTKLKDKPIVARASGQ